MPDKPVETNTAKSQTANLSEGRTNVLAVDGARTNVLNPQLVQGQTKPLSSMGGLSSLDRLTRLYEIMRSINSITQLDNLLYQILASTVQMVDARGGFLMLVDPDTGLLRCEVTSGRVASGLK